MGAPQLYKLLYLLGVLEIEGNLQCNEGGSKPSGKERNKNVLYFAISKKLASRCT
jgi:hypothetical protein